jgi:hypothetical protein
VSLFDANPFLARGKEPRKPRAAPERKVIPVSDIYADETWRLVVKSEPGVVHAERASVEIGASLGHLSWCGKYGVPLTFDAGERVNGCLDCVAAMKAGAP